MKWEKYKKILFRPFVWFQRRTMRHEQLYKIFLPLYGAHTEEEIEKYEHTIQKKYVVIAAVTLIFILLSVLYAATGSTPLKNLLRPEPGESSMEVPVEVQASYGDSRWKGKTSISIQSRVLSDKEIEAELDQCERFLKTLFPKGKNGQMTVSSSLDLPSKYGDAGTGIQWSSSDPVLLSESGAVDVLALAGKSETVTLTAELSCSGHTRSVDYQVLVCRNAAAYGESMKTRVKRFLSEINEDPEQSEITFPSELGGNVRLEWKIRRKSPSVMVFFLGLMAFLSVYSGRYSRAVKRVKKYRERVIAAFPGMLDKLILLLNSGMTVLGALMRLSEDYAGNSYGAASPLGKEAAEIGRRVKATNANMVTEWKHFAGRMESADMLRFCTILEDNMNTGAELAEKLEREGMQMREMRRKEMRKKIHLVDSRMMFPMMLMLFSLILITIAPTLLTFNG